jgi:hypothetical protein
LFSCSLLIVNRNLIKFLYFSLFDPQILDQNLLLIDVERREPIVLVLSIHEPAHGGHARTNQVGRTTSSTGSHLVESLTFLEGRRLRGN